MIRFIAIFTMLLDHIGTVFFSEVQLFNILGRLAFPLFAWGVVKGYRHTKNIKIYAFRLLLLGLISQLPYSILFDTYRPNICFTLLAGLMFLKLYSSGLASWYKATLTVILFTSVQYYDFEYGIYGLLTIFIFYYFYNQERMFLYQAALTLACILIFRYDAIQIFAALSPLMILLLDKKDFPVNRFIQYSFYPIHLLVLLILRNW